MYNSSIHFTSVAICGIIGATKTPFWTKSGGRHPNFTLFCKKKTKINLAMAEN